MPCIWRAILADGKVLPRSDYGPAFQRYVTLLLVRHQDVGDLVPDTGPYRGPRRELDAVETIPLAGHAYLVVLPALQNVTRSPWIIISYHKRHHTLGAMYYSFVG